MADSQDIAANLRSCLGVDVGATTADGVFTLETTECLGQCDSAPGMSIDAQYYGNLTAEKIKPILQIYQSKKRARRK
jgi:NADH:ubiquinone oxidoreductase subunit E